MLVMDHSTNPLVQVAALGRVATVWAHPDDETYLAGGLMAMARRIGHAVTCVTATNGDLAADDGERSRIGAIRSAEVISALAVLGVDDGVQLGLRDGECDRVDDDSAIATIAAILSDRAPDTVVTFAPDGLTGHPDHRAVARWTTAATRLACPTAKILVPVVTPEIEAGDRDINDRFDVFEPGTPTLHHHSDLAIQLNLTGEWLDLKFRALQAHASQTHGLIAGLGEERYRRWIAREPFLPLASWSTSPSSSSG
jgi:LmbE family N-acetylglucosaminyl deacetylase